MLRRTKLGGFTLAVALLLPAASARSARPSDDPLAGVEQQFQAGNFAEAVGALRSLAAQQPQDAAVFYWLGRCYYELHDYSSAATAAERSVKLDPRNSVYHQWLGRIYGEKADRDHSFFLARRTRKEFEEAVRLDPSNLTARRDLEEFYLGAPWILGGSRDEAREQVDAIVAINPLVGHLARATFWNDLKKPDLAENEYRLVLAAKPAQIAPYMEVASFFASRGKVAELENVIALVAAVNSGDPRLAYYRGVARVLSGNNLSAAEQYLKSYLASTQDRSDWPSHAAAREWLGRLYEREGKRMDAAEQYRAALQLDPDRKEARHRLQQLEKSSP